MFAPNSLIEKILQLAKPQAAMTLDAMFASDVIQWPHYDFPAIMGQFQLMGLSIGEAIVRRGLADLRRLGLVSVRLIMNRERGRPTFEYRLESVASMATVLGITLHYQEHCDAIPKESFKSVRAYRASKHYTYIKRTQGKQSRKFLGQRLGVGRRSTANYEKGTDIKITFTLGSEPLSKDDIARLPKKRVSGRYYLISEWLRDLTEEEYKEAHAGKDPAFSIFWRKQKMEVRIFPYLACILKRELELGHDVYKTWQSTNLYS